MIIIYFWWHAVWWNLLPKNTQTPMIVPKDPPSQPRIKYLHANATLEIEGPVQRRSGAAQNEQPPPCLYHAVTGSDPDDVLLSES